MQTARTRLHLSSNHCPNWLRQRSQKWCSNGSIFVTDNSDYIRCFFYNCTHCTNKTQIVWIETELTFYPWPPVYVYALRLCCFQFYNLINTQTFLRVLTASVDSCTDINTAPSVVSPILAEFGGWCWNALTASLDSCVEMKCPFSCITNSGRVWRQVPESDAGSVVSMQRAPWPSKEQPSLQTPFTAS